MLFIYYSNSTVVLKCIVLCTTSYLKDDDDFTIFCIDVYSAVQGLIPQQVVSYSSHFCSSSLDVTVDEIIKIGPDLAQLL